MTESSTRNDTWCVSYCLRGVLFVEILGKKSNSIVIGKNCYNFDIVFCLEGLSTSCKNGDNS